MTTSFDPERPLARSQAKKRKKNRWALVAGVVVAGCVVLLAITHVGSRADSSSPSNSAGSSFANKIPDDQMETVADPCNQAFSSLFDVVASEGVGADHEEAESAEQGHAQACLAAANQTRQSTDNLSPICISSLEKVGDYLQDALPEAETAHSIGQQMNSLSASIPSGMTDIPLGVRDSAQQLSGMFLQHTKKISIIYTRFVYGAKDCGRMPILSALLDRNTITSLGEVPPEQAQDN